MAKESVTKEAGQDAGPSEDERRRGRCAAVLDALTDPEIRTMILLIVAPAIAAATTSKADVYDLKPEAFRRPLPGIHVL